MGALVPTCKEPDPLATCITLEAGSSCSPDESRAGQHLEVSLETPSTESQPGLVSSHTTMRCQRVPAEQEQKVHPHDDLWYKVSAEGNRGADSTQTHTPPHCSLEKGGRTASVLPAPSEEGAGRGWAHFTSRASEWPLESQGQLSRLPLPVPVGQNLKHPDRAESEPLCPLTALLAQLCPQPRNSTERAAGRQATWMERLGGHLCPWTLRTPPCETKGAGHPHPQQMSPTPVCRKAEVCLAPPEHKTARTSS